MEVIILIMLLLMAILLLIVGFTYSRSLGLEKALEEEITLLELKADRINKALDYMDKHYFKELDGYLMNNEDNEELYEILKGNK